MQIKSRWIGLSISILILILVTLLFSIPNYFVHNTPDLKIWISCQSDVRLVFESSEQNVFGQEREDLLQTTIYEKCGVIPHNSLWIFRDSMQDLKNFIFDNPIQMFIPFGHLIIPILILFVGYYIGIRRENKN